MRPVPLTLLISATALLGACVGGSRVLVSPLVKAEGPYLNHPGHTAPHGSGPAWWTTFEDRTLNRLVERGLKENFELAALTARIDQASAALRQAGGKLFPQVDAGGTYGSRWTDTDADTQAVRSTSAVLDGGLRWEIDLWGRLRSAREAQRQERDASVADWQGARLLLSASIAEVYFEILEQQLQRDLLQEQLEVGQTLLDLTELRFGQAQSSIVDVLQQREQLEATQTLIPTTEARLEGLTHTLAILIGRVPGSEPLVTPKSLRPPPQLPHIGRPQDLLLHRPDLQAASKRVAALDHAVAEAVADRLPRLSLSGSVSGLGAPGLDTLISEALASVAAPLIDGGVRRAEIDRRQAALREALSTFSQRYLEAVGEVETALVSEQKEAERGRLLEQQLDTARKLLRESRNRYSQGLTDYLPVLTALTTVQRLEREWLSSKRARLSARVSLFRTLGGPMQGDAS